jgi:dihydrofolate reductase
MTLSCQTETERAYSKHIPDTCPMAKLIYSAITSLDGYVEDAEGTFDWGAPSDEVLNFLIDLERPVGTYLYGRRMYETMVYWETADVDRGERPADWAWMELWQAAEKVVYSTSLKAVSSTRTRIEPEFDPAAVRAMKDAAHDRDITVGGPDLAAQAFKAGLVDECQLFLTPVIVGGGKPALPDNVRLPLQLVDERRFADGVVFLRYRTSATAVTG